MGGGSFAEYPVPSQELVLRGQVAEDAERLHVSLRAGEPAILARVGDGAVMFDLRSLEVAEVEVIAECLIALFRAAAKETR